jgi:hypothetical protein
MTKPPFKTSRRSVLYGGTAAGVLSATRLSAQMAPRDLKGLKVTVIVNGATYVYPGGPQIPSYFVGFRDDGRIVFHLGALGDLAKPNARPTPYHLGAHHVKIESGSTVLFDQDIPGHWWNAQWTFRPAPIAIKRSPAEIVAANRMFLFGDVGARSRSSANYIFKGPMDSAGMTIYMPTTGERPDIGLITDPSAQFMLGEKPGPMLAWAQAAGSCPMHFRDEKTAKPINLIQYPATNSYSGPQQGGPWLLRGPMVKAQNGTEWPTWGGGWDPQQAHYTEMSYLAYCATLDAGFLEDLQYSGNFTVLCDGYVSAQRGIATVSGEYRGIAWAFRNLFMAHAATQDAEAGGTLPASCHPSSYWKKLLDNQLAYHSKSMADPANQIFRLVSGGDSPWQWDYMLMALAFGVLTGHSNWASLYLWALKNAIDRTSGKSGFPPGYGTPYRLGTDPAGWAAAFKGLMTNPEVKMPQAQYDALIADPLNGGKAMVGGEYLMTTRAVLIMAAYLEKKGLVNVRAIYPELDICIANVARMVRGPVNPRTSVIS